MTVQANGPVSHPGVESAPLVVADVSKRYKGDVGANRNISLEAYPGEILGMKERPGFCIYDTETDTFERTEI